MSSEHGCYPSEHGKIALKEVADEGSFNATCIHCGATENIQLWPHRNGHGDMVGMVFACAACTDVVRGIWLEIHGIRGHKKETKEIKAQTVRQAARACQPLKGADAQALEGALQQTERDYARALECIRDAKAVVGCLLTWYDESDLSAALANVPEALADIIAKALQWENQNAGLWLRAQEASHE